MEGEPANDEPDTRRPKAGERWMEVQNIEDVQNLGVSTGFDAELPSFIAQTQNHGDWIPCRAVLSSGNLTCYAYINKQQKEMEDYKILQKPTCCELFWKEASMGEIPNNAAIGGRTERGYPLYIIRMKSGVICDSRKIRGSGTEEPETYDVLVHDHE